MGAGVGGHCIPVDPWFLISGFPGITGLLELARKINDAQPSHLIDRAEAAGLAARARVAVLGVAYRGNIADARESPSERLIEALGRRGYRWAAHDPHVTRWSTHLGNYTIQRDLVAVLKNADAVFIMTDHDAYRCLGPDDLSVMPGRLIVDGRRILKDRAFVDSGFTLVRAGAPVLKSSGSQ